MVMVMMMKMVMVMVMVVVVVMVMVMVMVMVILTWRWEIGKRAIGGLVLAKAASIRTVLVIPKTSVILVIRGLYRAGVNIQIFQLMRSDFLLPFCIVWVLFLWMIGFKISHLCNLFCPF